MASNTTDFVTADYHPPPSHAPTRRRMSWRTSVSQHSDPIATAHDPHSALLLGHDHDGLNERVRQRRGNTEHDGEQNTSFVNKTTSNKIEKMIAPYLAHHIPQQYNPLGGGGEQSVPANANTKYCYRHRPDMLCRKQADEPTMEQLQEELGKESQADQQSIANVWTLFSAAPARQRNLMLQGILSTCCFPQLSFISSNVRSLLKIDFLSALPPELGFKILCYLDTTSLCKASQVSHRWRNLADDDVVWHKMCEQHIDRKCTKCGWGLPLMDQRRLRTEKRRIQLRASGRGLNEWSPSITPAADVPAPAEHPSSHDSGLSESSTPVGAKRPAVEDESSPEPSKRPCTAAVAVRDQGESYFDKSKKRPWKDVYKDRFKVGTNWKYGRCTTRILRGHTNGVMCLQFDDQTLITGSYDNTIKVWDVNTGKEIRTITGHRLPIRCMQFDDARLITGSLDGTIKIWDWKTGVCKLTISAHAQGVIGLHMVDKLLASGSADHTISVYDLGSKQKFKLLGHEDWVNSVKIDLPSRTLFSASDDTTVKLWDLDTQTCIKTFEGHVGQVQQVLPLPAELDIDEADFEPNTNSGSDTASLASENPNSSCQSGSADTESFFPQDPTRPAPPTYMLTGSLDGTIRLWHVPSGRTVHSFLGHIEGVWSLAVDTLRLVSGAEDKLIKIWDPRTGRHERTIAGHEGPVNCVGLSDSRLISGSEDGTVRIHCFEIEK